MGTPSPREAPGGDGAAERALRAPATVLCPARSVDGPCVPYIEPYLALVAYVCETFPDTVPSPQTGQPLIHFAKREKWYGAVQEMLRHQTHAYDFPEDSQTAELVESNVTSIAQDQNFVALPHQTEVDITNMKKVLESLP